MQYSLQQDIQFFIELSSFLRSEKNKRTDHFNAVCCYFFLQLFNCSLNRYFKQNSRLNNLCAAFFGGFPFYYHPQLQWLTHAACCSIELLWSQILLSNFGMASSLDKIPFARILFALGIGYSAHIKVFRPWLTPKFAHRSLTILTNNL